MSNTWQSVCAPFHERASLRFSGNVGLTCSLLISRCAKPLSHAASAMHGSTSTCVLAVNNIVARRSSLNLGFVNKRMVFETFHRLAEDVMRPHSVRVASDVSSNTLTSTFSTWNPALVVTVTAFINSPVYRVGGRLTLPPSGDALDTDEYLSFRNIASAFDEVFQRHEPGQLFPSSVAQRCSTQGAIVAVVLHQNVATVVSFGKYRGVEQRILQRQGRGLSGGQVRRPD